MQRHISLSIVKHLQLFPIVVHVPIFLRNCNWVFKARLKPNTIFPLNFTPIKQYPNEILSHKRISSYSIMAILWEGHTFRIWVFNMLKTIQFYEADNLVWHLSEEAYQFKFSAMTSLTDTTEKVELTWKSQWMFMPTCLVNQ